MGTRNLSSAVMRVVGLVLAMVLLLSFTTQSAATVPFLTAPHQFPDVSVGPDASALGVTEYTDVCEEGGAQSSISAIVMRPAAAKCGSTTLGTARESFWNL